MLGPVPCQHSDSVFAGLPARFGGSPVITNLCSRPKPAPEATVFSAPSTDSPAHTPRTVGWHSSSVLDSAASQIRTSASSPRTRAPPSSAPSTWFGSSPAPLRQYDPCSGSADELRELNLAVTLRANEASILYNAACLYCSLKRKPEALGCFAQSLGSGFQGLSVGP